MEIHRNGRPVTLTCKEFNTLAYLIKNPRRVISRDELLNEVWGCENYPCTRTVDTHILRLCKKLEPEPAIPSTFIRSTTRDTSFCRKDRSPVSPHASENRRPDYGPADWPGQLFNKFSRPGKSPTRGLNVRGRRLRGEFVDQSVVRICQGRSKREPVWRSKSRPVEGYRSAGRMASGA
jgi:hypothetical protein